MFGHKSGTKNSLRHFAHPTLNFTRVQNSKFGLDFRQQSPLKRSGFEMKQQIANLKYVTHYPTKLAPIQKDFVFCVNKMLPKK